MQIKPIFEDETECKLFSICYDGDRSVDIFRILMNRWSDTNYLYNYFHSNAHLLQVKFWDYLSISDAIDQVMDEASEFEIELRMIERDANNDKNKLLNSIFMPLHEGLYQLKRENLLYKKAKPDSYKPMIRLYAYSLDDCYIITGGLIKLIHNMDGLEFDKEFKNLERLKQYIADEGIYSIKGLLE